MGMGNGNLLRADFVYIDTYIFFLDTGSLVSYAPSPHLHTQQLPFPHLPRSISLHTFLKMYNQ